jgi:hypothetical protein
MQKQIEELKKRLLKAQGNYVLLDKNHPNTECFDILTGIKIAIIEFNAVFGEETCPIESIAMRAVIDEA